MTSTRELFLSPRNLEEKFNHVSDEILKSSGYNISNQPRLRKTFNSMAEITINKTPEDNQNLTNLNTLLVNKCTSYFNKIIKERNLKKAEQTNTNNNMTPNVNLTHDLNMQGKVEFNEQLGFSYMKDNQDMNKKYNELLQDRNRIAQTNNSNTLLPQQDNRANELQSMYQSYGSKINEDESNRVNNQNGSGKTEGFNVAPFDISTIDDELNVGDVGEDLPLYQNVKSLQEQDNVDPMKLMEAMEKSRENNMQDYNLINQSQEEMRKNIMLQGKKDIVLERNNTDAMTKIDQTMIDPKLIHQNVDNWQERMTNHVEQNVVDSNIVSNLSEKFDSILQNKIKELQIAAQPDYFERVHYISVNSADRKWETDSTDDTRYNFQVKFNASSDFSGAGINTIYKNIISVELVNAILPIDAHIEPFDTRIYMSVMKYPYLLLRIEELDGVFRGTNVSNDKAFSTLVFDKFFNSEVLSSDHITSNVNSAVKTSFSNEFKRGYIRYNPAYFEKKKYYNAPLASLNKMTITLTDHRGNAFNNQADVLGINAIAFTGTLSSLTDTDFEINPTNSFPYVATSTRKMIEITTTKYFSNRLFRIGDTIQINGFVLGAGGANNSKFQSFINREEGHTIINLQKEINDESASANNGQLNKIYIAPPGTLDANNQTLDTSTYYDTGLDFTGATYGSLLNHSLQTHFLFRIVTREHNVSNVTKPINV